MAGIAFLAAMLAACLFTLPYTLSPVSLRDGGQVPRYSAGLVSHARIPPAFWPRAWWTDSPIQTQRLNALVEPDTLAAIAAELSIDPDDAARDTRGPAADRLRPHWPAYALGTDALGRSLAIRLLTGGGISLGIGIAAAALSVLIGTAYGAIAGYAGGRLDAVMMRIVDILYGLPYILLVVLLAVAVDAWVEKSMAARVESVSIQRQRWVTQQLAARDDPPADPDAARADLERQALDRFGTGELSAGSISAINVTTLLVAIGGVSWLTMSRVIRGQVLSLKAQPFVEAARAAGLPTTRIFLRHLLPNLLGPIIVYATLTVPQAILQESFLSFLGIGVKPPLPSWGNLAAEGLSELNTYQSNWWLLFFPCLILGSTLLAMNFVGEGLREAFDPRRTRR
jgi:ABC-type dipeptide/oligopeptide/nickel transport system permease subunit